MTIDEVIQNFPNGNEIEKTYYNFVRIAVKR